MKYFNMISDRRTTEERSKGMEYSSATDADLIKGLLYKILHKTEIIDLVPAKRPFFLEWWKSQTGKRGLFVYLSINYAYFISLRF